MKNNVLSFNWKQKKKSINEKIRELEFKTYKEDKSLIILTGQMLRLGISLPCADIAFNFDNVSSVDQNYQTMFRVLTERADKENGFYFDFYPERSINFLYEFNAIYGSGFKNKTTEDLIDKLRATMVLFQYNGFGLIKSSPDESLALYDKLVINLKLNKEGWASFYSKNPIKFLEKLLLEVDINDFDLLRFDTEKSKKGIQIKEKLKIGSSEKVDILVVGQIARQDKEDDKDDKDDKSEDEKKKIREEIAQSLVLITRILALFSADVDFECDTLEKCLDGAIKQIDDLKEFCDCSLEGEEAYSIIGCYIKDIKDLNKSEVLESLQQFKNILEKSNNEEIVNSLIILFDNIKDTMGVKTNLIYNMNAKDIQAKIEKYLPVKIKEKDEYGEVFTPQILIEEMLDHLPKSVWKNKDLKWLDPANGIGNFPMVAYMKLMEGLKDVIPNVKTDANILLKICCIWLKSIQKMLLLLKKYLEKMQI